MRKVRLEKLSSRHKVTCLIHGEIEFKLSVECTFLVIHIIIIKNLIKLEEGDPNNVEQCCPVLIIPFLGDFKHLNHKEKTEFDRVRKLLLSCHWVLETLKNIWDTIQREYLSQKKAADRLDPSVEH